jgi:hypothetical protein
MTDKYNFGYKFIIIKSQGFAMEVKVKWQYGSAVPADMKKKAGANQKNVTAVKRIVSRKKNNTSEKIRLLNLSRGFWIIILSGIFGF